MQVVTLDTSLCVSALVFSRPDGVPALAIKKAVTYDILATSSETEAELSRILIEKFFWEREAVAARLSFLFARSLRVQLLGSVKVCRDPYDDMFLECAWRSHSALLVTGDKDLLVLRSFEGTKIVTPAQYVRGEY